MGKFFFKPDERTGETVSFTGQAAHHLLNVLRLRTGQEITLCDGQCMDYRAKLISITDKPTSITFVLLSHSPSNTETAIPVTLYQGLPKGDKMEWIIEKCIEVGVNKIAPVCTARSVIKIKDATKKAERFARIANSAASQSMRGIVPEVLPPQSLPEALAECNDLDLCLVAYENEFTHTIKSVLGRLSPQPVSLWIGPEGGFEDCEVQMLEEKGAIPISLGPRILRTETAGLVALSQILCIWDNEVQKEVAIKAGADIRVI